MKHYKNTEQFYNGEDWANCKAQVLQERLKDGALYCEECGGLIVKDFNPNANNNKGALVFHHKRYLTNENVNDASISINPENIACLHWSCHNKVHERFIGGKREKKVYIVTGAPCSGKSSWVKERAEKGDIVFDIDTLWQCISGQPRYTKPKALNNLIFLLRRDIKDYITRSSFDNWRNAYIIESLPLAKDRRDEAERYKNYNVEVITMNASKEECLQRLLDDPNGRDVKEYTAFIENYFKRYTPDTND